MSLPDYQLRVDLEDVDPPVWRRVRVPGSLSFSELHVVLQAGMGWEDRHLYRFEIAEQVFVDPTLMDDDPWDALDARHQGLADFAPHRGDEFRYVYDFGDRWSHRIRVEDVDYDAHVDPEEESARCLDGAGRCPPEDSLGPPGYGRMLEALDDPSHPDRDRALRHLGPDFDPEWFSTMAANAALTGLFESGGRLTGGSLASDEVDVGPAIPTGEAGPGRAEEIELDPDAASALDEILERLDERAGSEPRIDDAVRSVAEDLLLLFVKQDAGALPRARKPATWSAGALHAAFMELRRWKSPEERVTIGQAAELFGISEGSVARRSRELRDAAGDVRFLPFPSDPAHARLVAKLFGQLESESQPGPSEDE